MTDKGQPALTLCANCGAEVVFVAGEPWHHADETDSLCQRPAPAAVPSPSTVEEARVARVEAIVLVDRFRDACRDMDTISWRDTSYEARFRAWSDAREALLQWMFTHVPDPSERTRASAADRELAALSSDKQTLMTAVTHWREQAESERTRREGLEEAKDGAYAERNKTVIALAHMARLAGYRVGTHEHEGEDWEDDWRAILMIDLPTGQASWHFHDSERPLLAGFAPYPDEWDGHTTDEKYARLAALAAAPGDVPAPTEEK